MTASTAWAPLSAACAPANWSPTWPGHTLVATGGFGRIYRNSTNAVINDGGGLIIAQDTGLTPLGNMEAVQFHPTGIVPSDILVTEGCRGDGGTLLDADQERFMHIYEPDKAELASRDVVSRWMTHHMRQGKGVKSPYGDHLWLDIRHLGEEHIRTKLREVDEICQSFLGIDPVHELIAVRPTQHYSMGGVRTDKTGAAYGLKGLFSAGEAACWDMHGFNRLGGNSLAETVVAGGIVGKSMAEYLAGCEAAFPTATVRDAEARESERLRKIVSGENGNEDVFKVREAMFDVLDYAAGIYRNHEDLERGVAELQEIHARAKQVSLKSNGMGASPELALAIKLPGMVRLALAVTYGALMRTESRGSHTPRGLPRAQRPRLAQPHPGLLEGRRRPARPAIRARLARLDDSPGRPRLRRRQDHLRGHAQDGLGPESRRQCRVPGTSGALTIHRNK